MAGQAALKAGAGLVTVATSDSALPAVAGYSWSCPNCTLDLAYRSA